MFTRTPLITLACPRRLAPFSSSAACAAVDSPRHSKNPHDRTLTILGIDTMGASSVRDDYHTERTGGQEVLEGTTSLTGPHEKRYRTCLVRTFYMKGGFYGHDLQTR